VIRLGTPVGQVSRILALFLPQSPSRPDAGAKSAEIMRIA